MRWEYYFNTFKHDHLYCMQIVTHDDPCDLFKGDPNTIDGCWRTIKVVKVSKGLPNKRLNGYTQAQLLHFPLV